MAWFRPDLYHRVLTYSGTYVNQQSPVNPQSPHGAWEYHENLIPKTDAKPLRVWLEVGENDNGSKRDEASLHNWVLANQRMAAALKAKGYHYRFVFAKGAGHTDGRSPARPSRRRWSGSGRATPPGEAAPTPLPATPGPEGRDGPGPRVVCLPAEVDPGRGKRRPRRGGGGEGVPGPLTSPASPLSTPEAELRDAPDRLKKRSAPERQDPGRGPARPRLLTSQVQ